MYIKRITNKQIKLIKDFIKVYLLSHIQHIEQNQFIVVDEIKLVYLNMPKVACSSIKLKMLEMTSSNEIENFSKNVHLYPWKVKNSLDPKESVYTSFTFVRNPLERLVSAYKNKFMEWHIHSKRFEYEDYLFGVFHQNMSFDEFVDIVCQIPDRLADGHFKQQTAFAYNGTKPVVDYVWKLEDIQNKSEDIYNTIGLSDFLQINKSTSSFWKYFYSKHNITKVVNRYTQDIELLGYREEIDKLISEVNKK